MDDIEKKLVPQSLPAEIITVIEMFNNGHVGNYSLERDSNGNIKFHADSNDKKQRLIIESQQLEGYVTKTTTLTTKLPPRDRQRLISHLLEENPSLTQAEIARKTAMSQKTVSNDIKAIKAIKDEGGTL